MTSSRPTCTSDEDGYATAAATVISLSIAMVAAGIVGASVQALKSARGDMRRTEVEYALAGDAITAAVVVASSKGEGRMGWTLQTDHGAAEVVAEPEAAKLGIEAAAALDDATLGRLGVGDGAALRKRLDALEQPGADPMGVRFADQAPLWRACASSAISPVGQGSGFGVAKAQAPVTANGVFRGGEVWRIEVSSRGWVEDRLVRFTGALDAPFRTIARELHRGEGSGRCDTLD